MNTLDNDFFRVTDEQLLKSNQHIYKSHVMDLGVVKSHPHICMEEVAFLKFSYAKGKIRSCDSSLILHRLQKLSQAHHFPLRKRI